MRVPFRLPCSLPPCYSGHASPLALRQVLVQVQVVVQELVLAQVLVRVHVLVQLEEPGQRLMDRQQTL